MNRICSLFGIKYPIIAGGMVWCSGWRLEKINIPFHVAEDPLRAVARGTCLALKNTENYTFLMR